MTKRCRRCRRFLGGNKAYCLTCKRIINRQKRDLNFQIVASPKNAVKMQVRCNFCQTKNGGGKSLGQHQREGNYLCSMCLKKIQANKEILDEFTQAPKPEVYMGKKEACGYCGEVTHLFKTKKSTKRVCKNCKAWLERMKHMPDIEVSA